MQGIDNHPRIQHIINRNLFTAEHRSRILTGILTLVHSDLSHLLWSCAELRHVPLSDECIARLGSDKTIRSIEFGINGRKGRELATGSRHPARIRYNTQYSRTHASINRCRGPPRHSSGGGSTELDLVKILWLKT